MVCWQLIIKRITGKMPVLQLTIKRITGKMPVLQLTIKQITGKIQLTDNRQDACSTINN